MAEEGARVIISAREAIRKEACEICFQKDGKKEG